MATDTNLAKVPQTFITCYFGLYSFQQQWCCINKDMIRRKQSGRRWNQTRFTDKEKIGNIEICYTIILINN